MNHDIRCTIGIPGIVCVQWSDEVCGGLDNLLRRNIDNYMTIEEYWTTVLYLITTPQTVSVSACYCIPQCVRLIAGSVRGILIKRIIKVYSAVDKSKIKDKRKVKPKD